MIADVPIRWVLIGMLVLFHVLACVRMARRMGQTGRSVPTWFLITFFFTGVPAMIVLYRDPARRAGPRSRRPRDQPSAPYVDLDHKPPIRCRHCRQLVPPEAVDDVDGLAACPFCGLPLDEVPLS